MKWAMGTDLRRERISVKHTIIERKRPAFCHYGSIQRQQLSAVFHWSCSLAHAGVNVRFHVDVAILSQQQRQSMQHCVCPTANELAVGTH